MMGERRGFFLCCFSGRAGWLTLMRNELVSTLLEVYRDRDATRCITIIWVISRNDSFYKHSKSEESLIPKIGNKVLIISISISHQTL